VAVELGRDPRVRVPHDPLHRWEIRAGHHKQEGSGVAGVVEAQRADLADRPELHLALGAAAKLRIGRELGLATAWASADVTLAGDDASAADVFWFASMVRQHAPWDYKDLTPDRELYRDAGNFNYGYAGSAAGLPADFLLWAVVSTR
jgi:hypothetical protein